MSKSFLTHVFSDADRLWLETAAATHPFDPRVSKAKLYDRLPKEFDPDHIDRRFYENNRLTILGIRIFRPDDPVLPTIDVVAKELKRLVLSQPGIDGIQTVELVAATGKPRRLVGDALGFMTNIGRFFSGLGIANEGAPESVWFTGPKGYDEILKYEDLDDLLDHWYQAASPSPHLDWLRSPSIPFDDTDRVPQRLDSSSKQGIAFVIMAIDPDKPELEDVLNAIKEACDAFAIKAYRADEIEHQDRITSVILEEIRGCEYLIADLSHERPNVYYEIGYAHALNKKPILYRKQGTKLHFDLLVHNVPEYKNATELKELIRRRFEAILGRAPNP